MRRGTTIVALTLLVGLVHHPRSHAQTAGVSPPATAGSTVDVTVLKVDRAGGVQPLAGAEVVVERWLGNAMRAPSLENRASGMVGIRLAGATVATSDAKGVARIKRPEPVPGQILALSVLHDGYTYGGEAFDPGRPAEVRIYERTEELDDVECELLVMMSVDEKMVFMDVTVTFQNTSPVLVDLDRKGLRIPMVLPAIRGEPVEGVLPDGALRNIRTQREPIRGRIRMEKGYPVYRGPIVPGSSQQLRLRYGIPIERADLELAIRAPLATNRIRLLGRWSRRIAPRLIPARTFTAFDRDDGEYRQRQIMIDGPLPAGKPLIVRLDRLPKASSAEAAVALVGSLILLGLFGIAIVAPAGTFERRRSTS